MKVSGTFVWSVYTEVEVPDNASNEEQLEALRNSVEDFYPDGAPILHDCSNEDLID